MNSISLFGVQKLMFPVITDCHHSVANIHLSVLISNEIFCISFFENIFSHRSIMLNIGIASWYQYFMVLIQYFYHLEMISKPHYFDLILIWPHSIWLCLHIFCSVISLHYSIASGCFTYANRTLVCKLTSSGQTS